MNSWAQGEGQPGLGYIFWREDEEGGAGPVAKNLGPERSSAIRSSSASRKATRCSSPPATRRSSTSSPARRARASATELKLIDESQFALAWIVDFPMYEWNEEEKKIDFSHNPFSMPQGGLEALEAAKSNEDCLEIKAYQYDIVCNGFEIASGADPQPPARRS